MCVFTFIQYTPPIIDTRTTKPWVSMTHTWTNNPNKHTRSKKGTRK